MGYYGATSLRGFHMAKHALHVLLYAALTTLLWAGAASAGPWQPVGIGDCPGRDVASSRSPAPDPGKCDDKFAGFTAVCWTHGCTYKNVSTRQCTGGANPGQMYTCAAAPAARPVVVVPPAGRANWQPMGIGDCSGRDVAASVGPRPDPTKCSTSFAGNTAVCWTNGCTYKNVATASCTGGRNPGQMYTCAVSAPQSVPSGPVWQSTGVGDCPGRDVANTVGSRPDPSKCNANFVGNTAVCWSNACTYKSVLTGQCVGGAHPGQMYTCATPENLPRPVATSAPVPPPPSVPAPMPPGGAWQPVGVGDCPGRDVAGTQGPYPDPGKCNTTFAGNTAVCWATGCTYKNVETRQCTGGANPGQMYTCISAVAPAPAAPPAQHKVRGKRYSIINFTGDKQNPHEFIVDWKTCRVAEANREFESGSEDITVDVCRPGSRLIVKTDFRSNGHWIRYDWVVLDDGAVLAGSYRDPTTCGPSVGKRRR
jgi:hypothetical protein